ncbi:MAG: hypothetical protein H8D45_28530, partial [Bacteroidetes bacterium]|nr:hypothetical protein [Bacteroidota bacterium]
MELERLKEYYIKVKKVQQDILTSIKSIQDINEKIGEHDKSQPFGLNQAGVDQLLNRIEKNIKNKLF